VAHISEEDDFGLLIRYGADCIGAVGVLPDDSSAPVAEPASEAATNPGRTISGVQRKLLVFKDQAADGYRPAAATGPAPYIAKFNSENLPTLVRNENLSLRWLVALLGAGEVTGFTVGRVADEINETALIVTRFDRTTGGGKLRAEDFAQILRKPRGQDYAGKYDSSYEEVANVIRTHSVRPEIDLARLFRRLVAFVLLSNADAHLKNFTLLETPQGLRLSPAYDVVNVGVYASEGYDQQLALAIGGDKIAIEAVTHPLLHAFGERIDLGRSVIAGAFSELKTRVRAAETKLGIQGGDERDEFHAHYAEVVRNGCLRLLEE
jgi:serine/threonine-protein kinase HipA